VDWIGNFTDIVPLVVVYIVYTGFVQVLLHEYLGQAERT
jgi:hypothetical protein